MLFLGRARAGGLGARAGARFAVAAFKDPETREAAAITFLITSSGLSFGGISGAFWGLIGGGVMMALTRFLAGRRSS
jgi:benzoate membrane transport protein